MKRGIIALLIFIGKGLFIAGCGTGHYMLPAQPLEKKEWQISVVWHYDLNDLHLPVRSLFPDVNAYAGVGQDYNLGFGLHTWGWPSQVSVAKYWSEVENEYWLCYGHLSIGFTDNPPIELGAGFGKDYGGWDHLIALGLGVGQQPAGSFPATWYSAPSGSKGLIPTLNYSGRGSSIGVSASYRYRQTWTALEEFREAVLNQNDTLLVFEIGELADIRRVADSSPEPRWAEEAWEFISMAGDTATFVRKPGGIDIVWDARLDLEHWLGNRLKVYYYNDITVIVDMEQIINGWEQHDRVAVTRFSPVILERIRETRNILTDLSFGGSIMGSSHPD